MEKVLIGSDKSGFVMKEAVKAFLTEKGYTVVDCGTLSEDAVKPYFEVAPIAAKKIQSGEFEKAILICGTGAGMAVLANKYKGVYAVACESVFSAEKARAINDANVMTMGGWIVAPEMACKMAEKFLTTAFTQDLEPWRQEFLTKAKGTIANLEDTIYG